ncbi:hypothetical protein FG93_03674 [Bosea sp. LC85]|uniref:hypothetical protein n=1 Tax=Bosea sp. LC85 TaxID=1502851 RepID=UPI0004E3BC47|nr:hypothetical protein [Bosea sp. LC85]KFC69049.1 hypothetical protein FG93_03674 [Bosea sp. LC85]
MNDDTTKMAIGRVLRSFGGQVAVSVTASVAAAGVLAFLQIQSGAAHRATMAEQIVRASQPDAALANASEVPVNKFMERHRDQMSVGKAESVSSTRALAVPATLLMPMATAWTLPTGTTAALAHSEPQPGSAPVTAAVARTIPRERTKPSVAVAQPLPIAPPLHLAASAGDATPAVASAHGPSLLGLELPDGVTRAGRALGGLADRVGAAGTWTVSTASQLLPSW